MSKPIRIALTKGRLEKDTVGLFEKLGFDCTAVREKGRKLILPIPDANLEVVLAKANPLCLGARLSGGGFGGISVHLVKAENASEYARTIVAQYKQKTGTTLQDIICVPSEGAALI